MNRSFSTRTMRDETIAGGPFIRYIADCGTLYMITESIGESECVRGFCARMIQFQWGTYSVGAFRKCGCDTARIYWAEPIPEEIEIRDDMNVYQVPEENWMKPYE